MLIKPLYYRKQVNGAYKSQGEFRNQLFMSRYFILIILRAL